MLKIKNYQLVDVLEFFEKVELRPKASRVVTVRGRWFESNLRSQ